MTGRLRLLLWLRYRTVLRGRTRLAWVGFGASLVLVLLPLSLGGALLVRAGTLWAAGQEDPSILREWTHLVVLLLWFLFLLRPIFGFGGNEFYDITKLFHFPVSHRTVFVAQTIGLLFGGSAVFFLPSLVALAVSLPGGAAIAALRLLLILLFLFHGVALGQLLQLAMLNVLRSRRFRDLAPILGALVSGGIYLAFRFFSETSNPIDILRSVLDARLSAWLAPLPPAWVSSVLGPGAGLSGWLLFLFGFLPLTAIAVVLAASLQERAFHGEIAPPRVRAEGKGPVRARPARFPLTLLPGVARATMRKELRLLRREPVVKSLLIQQFVFFLVPVGFAIFSARGGVGPEAVLSWIVYPFLLIESVLVLNLLGLEGGGIQAAFLTPASRDHFLLGKLLAYLCLWGALNLAVLGAAIVALVVISDPPSGARVLVLGFEAMAALLVLLAIGAVMSPVVPTRLSGRGRGALAAGQVAREGCGVAVVRFLTMLVLLLLTAPVTLLARLTGSPLLAAAGLGYAFALFMAGYRFGSRLLESREERLISLLARSAE